ncbi:hypothetical protein EBU99_04550 [bacterium]|nr:hypothetical protein [bacterium]
MCSWRSNSLSRVRSSSLSVLFGSAVLFVATPALARHRSGAGSSQPPRQNVPAQPSAPSASSGGALGQATPSNDLVTSSLRYCAPGSSFTVATYNVENFWDDNANNSGANTYNEYKNGGSNWYSDQMYNVKAQRIADAIRMAGAPDIVAMEEHESANNTSRTLELLKPHLEALGYKFFALGQQNPNNPVAVTSAVVSKFPISKNERLDFSMTNDQVNDVGPNNETVDSLNSSARDPQVVTIDVQGTPLRLYASHWKSRRGGPGAGDAMRLAVAKLIKNDVDVQMQKTPGLDMLVMGDFNSYYDEEPLQNGMLSTDDKDSMKRDSSDPQMYNLWFELPAAERCSYMYNGQLQCIDHMLTSASLFDGKGIDLVEGSFQVVGHNGGEAAEKLMQSDGRTPKRWGMSKGSNGVRFTGTGYSDHLPLVATFKLAGRCKTSK